MATRCAFLMAFLLALAPATATPGAAEPVDLTGFIAPLPEVGDYKVFVEVGGEWVREEVVGVELVSGGWRVERRYADAEGDTRLVSELVAPGVEATRDYAGSGPGATPPFVGELASRARVLALSLSSERASRVSGRWNIWWVLADYRYKLRGRQQLAGIGPLQTPYTSHPEAAHVESRTRLATAYFAFGKNFSNPGYRSTGWIDTRKVASWYVDGIGLIGESGVRRSSKRGRVREILAYEIWLREGVIGGVPYP